MSTNYYARVTLSGFVFKCLMTTFTLTFLLDYFPHEDVDDKVFVVYAPGLPSQSKIEGDAYAGSYQNCQNGAVIKSNQSWNF